MITKDDERHKLSLEVGKAMRNYFEAFPLRAAVRWLEFTDGSAVIFTRGEYKDKLMQAVNENKLEAEYFEVVNTEEE